MQAEQQSERAFPFYELRFIMRVLSHEGSAPKEDWKTAYGMAREIFVRWSQEQQSERERFEAWAYVVKAKDGKEFLCLGTISRSKTKAKVRLNSLNASMAAKGRPFFEPVSIISVTIQP